MASPSAGAPALKYWDVNTVTPSPGEVKGLIKNSFLFVILIYNIIDIIPELSDLEPIADITPFMIILILNLLKKQFKIIRDIIIVKRRIMQMF